MVNSWCCSGCSLDDVLANFFDRAFSSSLVEDNYDSIFLGLVVGCGDFDAFVFSGRRSKR